MVLKPDSTIGPLDFESKALPLGTLFKKVLCAFESQLNVRVHKSTDYFELKCMTFLYYIIS